ncbi:MAG: type VI secretion system baseplate subunit TssK [Cellvibrionaceae bacterium]|nr:type VI secretion system baseplate subunit TssK [Cellvibrionaceae bacterium]
MSSTNKIAWLESQYLYPHHFQQQERYFEHTLEQRSAAIKPFVYGFSHYDINLGELNKQQFCLTKAKGILPDGTPFDMAVNATLPAPLEVPPNTKNQLIYLALPLYQQGHQFLTTDTNSQQIGRYTLEETDAFDYSAGNASLERIETARIQLRFMLESEEMGGFTYIPIARIIEVTAEKAIVLDKHFIPPVININANAVIRQYTDSILGLLMHRGNALSIRFQGNSNSGGSSAISDFLLLQVINRTEPRLRHLCNQAGRAHPEALYVELLGLMGELATFTTVEKRVSNVPAYKHDDLYETFWPLISKITQHLSAVLEQTAIALPVEKRQYGIYVSPIADHSLLDGSRFVLAIKASMTTQELKQYLPDHLKIGSVDTIRDLVNNQLTGVTISTLPMAPREITYQSGFVYFELDQNSEHWGNVKHSAGFAFHIAGELSELNIEFWAIRE